nr:glycosyltransferase family 2 protein [Lactiplantibacillus plantarum]
MTNIFIDHIFAATLFKSVINIALLILCLYPIVGSFFWFAGALSYRFIKTNKRDDDWQYIPAEQQPMITIMIPAHNEEVMIEETITYLFTQLNYTNYEVLVMNDGSTDKTATIIQRLQSVYPRLRTVEIEKNKGKAHAFNIGMYFAQGEYILSNDADTIPEKDALMKYMNFFIHDRDMNTSAVTANMDVQNRTSLLGKSQTVEFSSIVGVIKRSQTSINDSMYAYSGANTLYRKQFLIDVGGFRQNRATEDISIAWDHQMVGAVPRFAPNIVFHMNVPTTIRDLYHQRKRWAKGGTEVLLTNFKRVVSHPGKYLKQWAFITDQTLSIIWSLFFFVSTLIFLISLVTFFFTGNYERVYHMFCMAFIFVTFEMFAGVLQLLSALIVDDRGRKFKYLIFMPLYMLIYWQVNALALVTTLIPAVKTILGYGSGTWVSPVRKHHTE